MQRVVINGANGYVASHFISELLKNGYEVVALVRETANSSSEERMKDVLSEIDGSANLQNLSVYNYSLLEIDYALSENQLKEIFSGNIDFFHFAACLKFKSRDQDEIFKTNIDGAENSLQIFSNHATSASRFFYISTVYSCGKISHPFKEEFYENAPISEFRNYYEQSKRYAENKIKSYIDNANLDAHIVRLSQVVGDNRSGITKTNYGIFDFIKKIQTFSENYPNEKIRVRIDPDSTQNLIPINNVVTYFMRVLKKNEVPLIMNFVGRKPVKNDMIIQSVCQVLPVEIIQKKSLDRKELNKMERMVAAGMSFTGVYAHTKLKFDTKNLEKTVSPNGNEVTAESLYKMISYFVGEQPQKQQKIEKMS